MFERTLFEWYIHFDCSVYAEVYDSRISYWLKITKVPFKDEQGRCSEVSETTSPQSFCVYFAKQSSFFAIYAAVITCLQLLIGFVVV